MKKYFLSLVAIAAAMLFATSCQESLVEPQIEGPTTFTVQLPDQMGTKAFGEAGIVTELLVEVYPQNGESVIYQTVEQGTGQFEVSLNLIQDQAYDILFWAQTEDGYVDVTETDGKYSFGSLRNVPMNSNYLNNDNGAAFFHAEKGFVPNGTSTTITLVRPFAQLNLGTTPASLITDAGEYELVSSAITVTGMANSFNVFSGEGFGNAVATYNFNSQPVPNPNDEVLSVANDTYEYVSMNYLSVLGNEKALVDIDATIVVKKGTEHKTINHSFTSVPVQENYRTNIVGNLISSTTDFNVVVDAEFDGELPQTAEDKLRMAAQVGGEFTLTEDIRLSQPLEVTGNMVINMNRKTISGEWHKDEGAIIKNNGNLKLVGGTIKSLGNNGGSAVQNNGFMTIDDVTLNGAPNADGSWPSYTVNNTGELTINNTKITSYHGSVASYGDGAVVTLTNSEIDMTGISGFTSHGIYTYNAGKVVVNGGTYANKATDQASSGASVINGAVEVNAGTFSGRIENYYGTPVLKGGTYSVKPKDNFIAAGYEAFEKDGKYYVIEEVDIVITDPAQLTNDVIENNKTIYLAAGEYTIELYTNISPKESLTIIGTEGTKVKFANQQVRLQLFNNFTIKNCEILRMPNKNWGMLVFSSGEKANGVYTIENCTFNGVGTQGIYINETVSGAKYNIENCTFNGDFGTEGAITISTHQGVNHIVNVTGCEFNNVPADHRISLTKSNDGLFYDFTLKTDLKATTNKEVAMFIALCNPEIKLAAGNYKIDLYNINYRKDLTITGTDGTMVEFANQQVVTYRFSNLLIQNCEILRNQDKGWGMLVFAGNIDGVYTIKNCTFNGVGTNGIYINQDKSASPATYNIIDCTFNGDFGKDLAVAIQNNQGVNHSVNVTNCTFNNSQDQEKDVKVFYNYSGLSLNIVGDGQVDWAQGPLQN